MIKKLWTKFLFRRHCFHFKICHIHLQPLDDKGICHTCRMNYNKLNYSRSNYALMSDALDKAKKLSMACYASR